MYSKIWSWKKIVKIEQIQERYVKWVLRLEKNDVTIHYFRTIKKIKIVTETE